eukprot:RCo038932
MAQQRWFHSLRLFLTGTWQFQRTIFLKGGPQIANLENGRATFTPLPVADVERYADALCSKPHGQSLVTPVMTGPDSFNSIPSGLWGTLRNALVYHEQGKMTFSSGGSPVDISGHYLYLFPPPFSTVAEVRVLCNDPADNLDFLYKIPFPSDRDPPSGTAEYVFQNTRFKGVVEIEDPEWFSTEWEVEGPGSHSVVRTMYGKVPEPARKPANPKS